MSDLEPGQIAKASIEADGNMLLRSHAGSVHCLIAHMAEQAWFNLGGGGSFASGTEGKLAGRILRVTLEIRDPTRLPKPSGGFTGRTRWRDVRPCEELVPGLTEQGKADVAFFLRIPEWEERMKWLFKCYGNNLEIAITVIMAAGYAVSLSDLQARGFRSGC